MCAAYRLWGGRLQNHSQSGPNEKLLCIIAYLWRVVTNKSNATSQSIVWYYRCETYSVE